MIKAKKGVIRKKNLKHSAGNINMYKFCHSLLHVINFLWDNLQNDLMLEPNR